MLISEEKSTTDLMGDGRVGITGVGDFYLPG